MDQPPAKNALADMHVHLHDGMYTRDRAEVLQRARGCGVRLFACNGTREKDWPDVAAIARAEPDVIPFYGLHPWYAPKRSDDWLDLLQSYLEKGGCGIGEIGIDGSIENRNEEEQETVFRQQMELALKYDVPVTIHCVKAWDWFFEILDTIETPRSMLMHGYGGSAQLVGRLVKTGAYFSFPGMIIDPRRTRIRESLAAVPADRLLLETDAPFMAPKQQFCPDHFRTFGKRVRNEPCLLPHVLATAAELRCVCAEELAAAVRENEERFLGNVLPGK